MMKSLPHLVFHPIGICFSLGQEWVRAAAVLLPIVFAVFCILPLAARAQSLPTADRAGDFQVGGGIVFGKSTYNFNSSNLVGGSIYSSFDFGNHQLGGHWGVEANFRNSKPTSDSTVYERTYEIGPRYYFTAGRLVPYGKFMVGRGVYNYPNSAANVAYNLIAGGVGADFRIRRSINVRAEYELQNWFGFPLQSLRPGLVTVGVAYHFHE
jgi:Outer membrane protein beta-barrel domain